MGAMSVRRRIDSTPRAVYRALLDAETVGRWRAPQGMTATVHRFEARVGGTFRISLAYDDETRSGKSETNVDTYHGHFRELVPDRRVVEVVEFETTDPRLGGELTITTTLASEGGATEVTVEFDGLPEGVSLEDNERGTAMSLANLARILEER